MNLNTQQNTEPLVIVPDKQMEYIYSLLIKLDNKINNLDFMLREKYSCTCQEKTDKVKNDKYNIENEENHSFLNSCK